MPNIRNIIASKLVRLYPFYTGSGTIANSLPVRIISGSSVNVEWGKVAGGYEVAAPLDDFVGRAIYFAGELDPKVTWVCKKIVRAGDTVVDIGANLGLVSFILSSLVGPSGKVHAFEPNPRMQGFIESAIIRNGVANLKLHGCALGAEQCTLQLSVPDGHAGRASFLQERTISGAHLVAVPVERLTDVLKSESVGHIRFVKIDVEGYEASVIAGASEWFARDPPDSILFELNGTETLMRESRAVQMLHELGYRFFGLPKRYVAMCVRAVDINEPCVPGAHDYIGIHRNVISDEFLMGFNVSRR